MQRRKLTISLLGPWGSNKSATYTKCYFSFPTTYPSSAAPKISFEKTACLHDDIMTKLGADLATITEGFLSRQRSSLETVLRYILGEQNLEESLSWMIKAQGSFDPDSKIELDFSSSDEEDETLGKYVGPLLDMDGSDLMVAKANTQNSPPLPKACGALWADDGRLVCFFPPKQEQEASLLNLSLRTSERSSKQRTSIFEGFGRFHNQAQSKRQATSTLETIESGDSDLGESLSSSPESSISSDDIGIPRHHFMPSMAWRGDTSEGFLGVSIDESLKSSGDPGDIKSTISKEKNFVSIHDFSELLPSRKSLAKHYIVGRGSESCAHNARIAREMGDSELADVWCFAELLIQDKVPLMAMDDAEDFAHLGGARSSQVDPILIVAQRASSKLRFKDSAVDLSFDDKKKASVVTRAPIKWGHHPFGRNTFVRDL